MVDDEPDVRAAVRRMLARKGYTVLEAASAAEALGVCSRHDGPIELVVTDVVIPGLPGTELAAELARVRPMLKVLLMSG